MGFIHKEPPFFSNGNDDLFLKSPLAAIVKILAFYLACYT